MHKLDRSSISAPACLADYDYQTQTWDDMNGTCKKEVRLALFQLQGISDITSECHGAYGLRCAYCEGAIRHENHIEHFRRKNPNRSDAFPELTFAWRNLFLACGAREHCGHYKDRPAAPPYDPDQIIKPDERDPEIYLYFHSSGQVRERQDLSTDAQRLAAETIRVFGLNNRVLAGARAKAVSHYRKMKEEDFEELVSWNESNRQEYLRFEIDATRWEPYATTIKHFLQSSR